MERKLFLKGVGASLLTGVALNACVSPSEKENTSSEPKSSGWKPGTIIHSVYFWLRPELSESQRQEFLGFFDALKLVPGIASYHIASPAATTAREVVDNSFSYHWLATFNTLEDITTYEKHPDHLAAAERYSAFWTKVEVKDSVL